jgi:hypothetical protein
MENLSVMFKFELLCAPSVFSVSLWCVLLNVY